MVRDFEKMDMLESKKMLGFMKKIVDTLKNSRC